ncbi:hypothetical protein [Leptolyngbya sp. 7M]|uniref:hypothetical protein n=1 Tax=Leptolyngbya sp. 7M TaxID=2812896 RepID=UPI001B8D41EB|nr:hypothetical protein [Leptolyngbya sp. 7M]QYO68031.1 hypothetical protein JVX88_15395 [Leptolyngbya sp. 7M]
MTITEPTTMLTDYVLAGIAFILAGFLRVGWRRQQRSVCAWTAAFLFVPTQPYGSGVILSR